MPIDTILIQELFEVVLDIHRLHYENGQIKIITGNIYTPHIYIHICMHIDIESNKIILREKNYLYENPSGRSHFIFSSDNGSKLDKKCSKTGNNTHDTDHASIMKFHYGYVLNRFYIYNYRCLNTSK